MLKSPHMIYSKFGQSKVFKIVPNLFKKWSKLPDGALYTDRTYVLMLVSCSLMAQTSISLPLQNESKYITTNLILLCIKIQTAPLRDYFLQYLAPNL